MTECAFREECARDFLLPGSDMDAYCKYEEDDHVAECEGYQFYTEVIPERVHVAPENE